MYKNRKIINNPGWKGLVVENDDPEKSGRVQVYIEPLHGSINKTSLPWARPERGAFTGTSPSDSSNHYGEGNVPYIGSWVKVEFEDGDIMKPIYSTDISIRGSMPARFKGEEDDAYDTIESGRVSGDITEKGTAVGDYPNSKGWVLNSGIVMEFDETEGEERILIFHPSGYRQEILSDGSEVRHIPADGQEIVINDKEVYVGGDTTEKVVGKKTVDAGDQIKLIVGSSSLIIAPTEIKLEANRIDLN